MSVSIEEALAQLDPKLRKRLGSGVGVNYEYQPTPSFGLNRALGGGLPLWQTSSYMGIKVLCKVLYVPSNDCPSTSRGQTLCLD